MMQATPLDDLTEKEWQSQVVQLTKQLGYEGVYHTYDSRRSSSGFPDLCIVRERVVFLELKRAKGKLSPAQRHWIRSLLAAGAEVYVCRPADLQDLARVLAHRGDPWRDGRGDVPEIAARLREQTAKEAARE